MRQHTLVERHHPIFSPVAIISTLLLAGALAIIVYLTGGRAFNPGDLSAVNNGGQPLGGFHSHAEFGNDCAQCHEPFKGIMAERCETCHESVKQERLAAEGLHGRIQNVEKCANCHLDHRGSDYNLLANALTNFDHELTTFSLAQHELNYDGLSLDCVACHAGENDFTLSPTGCADCHTAADAPFMTLHRETYGGDCLACHDGLDTMAQFSLSDHAKIFPLDGRHQETTCESCHMDGRFEGTPQDCNACHAEPDIHLGLFEDNCAACHTPDDWLPATLNGKPFVHDEHTLFSLVTHITNYDGAAFTCVTCHAANDQFVFTDSQCADCHAAAEPQFVADHTAQFGADCMTCHDGTGNVANFDHALVWPLEGRHAAIECTDCHINRVFKDTSSECAACHEEPAIHAGVFGLDCGNCHTAVAWQPAELTYHSFPLDHGEQGEIACETCHTATYTQYTCYGCHEHDQAETEREHLEEGISQQEMADCVACHPTGREEEGEGDHD